jgi:hypothetical protein
MAINPYYSKTQTLLGRINRHPHYEPIHIKVFLLLAGILRLKDIIQIKNEDIGKLADKLLTIHEHMDSMFSYYDTLCSTIKYDSLHTKKAEI